MRAIYVYFMKDDPAHVGEVAPAHTAYWRSLELADYEGGPFADRSGGLITFECGSLEQARRLAARDPFVTEELVETRWVKEWRPIA